MFAALPFFSPLHIYTPSGENPPLSVGGFKSRSTRTSAHRPHRGGEEAGGASKAGGEGVAMECCQHRGHFRCGEGTIVRVVEEPARR